MTGGPRIFHPNDLTTSSMTAFAHAVRLAEHREASMTVLHVAPWGSEPRWDDFPSSAQLAERWGKPVPDLVRWVEAKGEPVAAILDYLDEHEFDLVVLSTSGRKGFDAWFTGSIAEPVSRICRAKTLFLPHGCSGMVSEQTGEVSLRRVLVPIGPELDPTAALDSIPQLAAWLEVDEPEILCCYIGDASDAPDLGRPMIVVPGDPAEQISALAEDREVDLIAMVTKGRQGFLDALRGSTTEQVVRGAGCPVLAINA